MSTIKHESEDVVRIPDSLLLLGGIGFVLAGIDNIFGLGLPIGYILAGIFIMYLGIKKIVSFNDQR